MMTKNSSKDPFPNLTGVEKLKAIMSALRDPDTGCKWDIKQTPESLIPFTIEEAYEVAEAIQNDDMPELKAELGDLLLQVIFYSQMTSEDGYFNFDDVVEQLNNKLIRRHPHVFGDSSAIDYADAKRQWDAKKEQERQKKSQNRDGYTSMMDDIPRDLPTQMYGFKMVNRAMKNGFDWSDVYGVLDKVKEELDEVKEAIEDGDEDDLQNEIGDLLLVSLTLCSKVGVNPEVSLRRAIKKFLHRFGAIEEEAYRRKIEVSEMTQDERDEQWNRAKQQERDLKKAAAKG